MRITVEDAKRLRGRELNLAGIALTEIPVRNAPHNYHLPPPVTLRLEGQFQTVPQINLSSFLFFWWVDSEFAQGKTQDDEFGTVEVEAFDGDAT